MALPLEPSKPEGLISIAVPGGTHQLQVTLETTPIERAGQVRESDFTLHCGHARCSQGAWQA